MGNPINLIKEGRPNEQAEWSIEINKLPKFKSLVSIVGNKSTFKKQMRENGYDKTFIDQSAKQKWFIANDKINLSKNPFSQLIRDNIIVNETKEEKSEKIKEILLEEVLENIQVYYWRYTKEYYISMNTIVAEFVQYPNKFKAVKGIFKIAYDNGAFDFKINSVNLKKYIENGESTARANLLKEVSKNFNKIFNKHWKTFWGKKIELKINYEGTNLTFRFFDGQECPPEYRSDGFKWFISFLINFQSKQKDLSNYILIMDEPGGRLHPKGQKDALRFLNNLNKKNQIFYSTHQTFLLDKNSPKNIRILDRTTKDNSNDFWPTQVQNVINDKKHILRDDLLREALGFTLTDISPINENNILVEGVFDRKVFSFVNQKFNIIDLNKTSIIECGKATSIKNTAQQYTKSDLKVVCIYDNDKTGSDALRNNTFLTQKYKLKISDQEGFTTEDILPDNILLSAINNFAKRNKIVERVDNISRPFLKETFEPILTKCKAKEKEEKRALKWQMEDFILDELNNKEENFDNIVTILKSIKSLLKK